MKILILSRGKNYYSTKRLVAEAQKLRHKAVVVNPADCNISLMQKQPYFTATANKHNLAGFDVVIPRIGIIGIDYALLVAHQLEFMGKPMLNSSRSLDYTKNKFLSLQILAKSGIPVPPTLMTRSPATVKDAIKQLGGLPVVLKLFRGSQGKGVMLGENIASVDSILTAVWAIGFDIILQKYLKETRGEDIRVLVMNNQVIATMKRTPAKNDFRSNIHQGGSIKKVVITEAEKQMALNATRALGLKLAGIDLMRTRTGPLVLEVNASPGFEGMEKITGINIARKIINFATTLNV
jgi:ribosomal protein S6--L-glutamate ligase